MSRCALILPLTVLSVAQSKVKARYMTSTWAEQPECPSMCRLFPAFTSNETHPLRPAASCLAHQNNMQFS